MIIGLLIIPIVLFLFAIERPRKTPRQKQKNKKINLPYKIGTVSRATYLNKVLNKVYPMIVDQEILLPYMSKKISKLAKDDSSIKRIQLDSITFEGTPLVVDDCKVMTSVMGDYIEINFHFEPLLSIDADIDIKIPYLNNVITVGATIKLQKIIGCIRFMIPEKKGNITFQIMEQSKVFCHAAARFGYNLNIKTEILGFVWTYLTNWVQKMVYKYKMHINIDKYIYQERDNKKNMNRPKRNRKIFRMYSDFSFSPSIIY